MNSEFECQICLNNFNNHPFIAKERLMGFGDEFIYFECSRCGCLQIRDIPENLAKYYPSEYYSFQSPRFPTKLNPLLYYLKKSLAKYYIGKFNLTGWLLSFYLEHPFPWLKSNLVNFNTKILDVGSGAGRKLLSMQRSGFKNLLGIDPFNDSDITYEGGLKILKKDVFEINEKYEFIMLHHSFEHMGSPNDVLIKLSELLDAKGCLLIRIPVANSYSWRKYKSFWYALDAPRHLFLHTTQSMQILAESAGLKIEDIEYDSLLNQFINSERYLRNLPPSDDNSFYPKKKIKALKKEVNRLNEINEGDCACFFLTKDNK